MSDLVLLLVTGVGLGALYFIAASGLSLIYGLMGVLNFAHGAFMTAGAYAAWLTMRALPGESAGGRAPARRRRRCRGGRGRGGAGRRGRPDPSALSPPHPAGAGHGGPLARGCRCGTGHLGRGPAAGGLPGLDGGDDRRARRPAPERPLRLRRRRGRALRRAPRPAAPDAPRTRHPGRGREPDDGRGPGHQRPPDLHGRLRPRRRCGRPGRGAVLALRGSRLTRAGRLAAHLRLHRRRHRRHGLADRHRRGRRGRRTRPAARELLRGERGRRPVASCCCSRWSSCSDRPP